jgi:hypothetical protein
VIAVAWLEREGSRLKLHSVTTPSMWAALTIFASLKDARIGHNVRLWFKGQLWCS